MGMECKDRVGEDYYHNISPELQQEFLLILITGTRTLPHYDGHCKLTSCEIQYLGATGTFTLYFRSHACTREIADSVYYCTWKNSVRLKLAHLFSHETCNEHRQVTRIMSSTWNITERLLRDY